MSDQKPPEKPTVEIQRPPDWAIALSEKVSIGLDKLEAKVDNLTDSVDVLQHDAKDTRLRLGRMERELDEVKDRQTKNSMRAQQGTDADMAHEAAIAALVVDVAALKETQAKQLAILEHLNRVAANPMVRRVAYAVGSALLAYLAAKGYLR